MTKLRLLIRHTAIGVELSAVPLVACVLIVQLTSFWSYGGVMSGFPGSNYHTSGSLLLVAMLLCTRVCVCVCVCGIAHCVHIIDFLTWLLINGSEYYYPLEHRS